MASNNQVVSNIIENQLIVVDESNSIILTCGVQGAAGSSGAVSFTNSDPTPDPVGGIPAGSTFDQVALEDMWQALLYPYQNPAFTSFNWTGRPSEIEVGDTLTGGVKSFTWGTSNPDNIEPNSIQISQSNTGVLASGLANDGVESIDIGSDLTYNVITSVYWSIQATNTNSNTFSRNTGSVTWKWKVFWGESEKLTLTEADIEGAELESEDLKTGRTGVYYVPPGTNQSYKFLCWPTVFGALNNPNTDVLDADEGYTVPFNDPYIVSVTNPFGVTQDYYVYRSYNPTASFINLVV